MVSPSVLLIGASGYLGPSISAEFLRQRSKFGRLAILTTEERKHKFESIKKEGFEIVLGSYFDVASFKGFDTVICLLGNDKMVDQPQIAQASFEAGVKDFYPSEFGSEFEQDSYKTNLYFVNKILTRNALRDIVARNPNSGFNYTVIIVGCLSEFAFDPLFGADPKTKTFIHYGDPNKLQEWTSNADTARYTVASTLLPKSPTQSRIFRVPGGLYSWNEVIATVNRVSGVEYKTTFAPAEEAKRISDESKAKGDVHNQSRYGLKYTIGRDGEVSVPKPWHNNLFDFKPEALEPALKRWVEEKNL